MTLSYNYYVLIGSKRVPVSRLSNGEIKYNYFSYYTSSDTGFPTKRFTFTGTTMSDLMFSFDCDRAQLDDWKDWLENIGKDTSPEGKTITIVYELTETTTSTKGSEETKSLYQFSWDYTGAVPVSWVMEGFDSTGAATMGTVSVVLSFDSMSIPVKIEPIVPPVPKWNSDSE